MELLDSKLKVEHFELLKLKNKTHIAYGTSGFREESHLLKFIAYRIGLYQGMKAKSVNHVLGVQVTASHNPIQDNGFKIIPPFGGMISQVEEEELQNFYLAENYTIPQTEVRGTVYVGRDNRASGVELSNLVIQGIKDAGSDVLDMGIVTTPQAFFLIYAKNMHLMQQFDTSFYVNYFTDIFKRLVTKPIQSRVIIDCAQGVGGTWINEFKYKLQDILIIETINQGEEPSLLNNSCGSEFVQKTKQIPANWIQLPDARYVSIDGDADRLVYYMVSDNLKLIEGDRFAILIAQYIIEELKLQNLHFNIGIIQTAYANSASTEFIKNMGVDAKFVATGVKHLHNASHKYDIGIYFEANGHGSITLSKQVIDSVQGDLKQLLLLCNPAQGDSIVNILMTEFILQKKQISMDQWLNLYNDYPCLTKKIKCSNKNIITTNFEETQVENPVELRLDLENLLKQYDPKYRVCVRPSGTEDVVRLHAEGPLLTIVEQISEQTIKILEKYLIQ